MTLVVNIFAGPGTGKSTTAAGLFALSKQEGVNCEIVHEFAKDLTWEKRQGALAFQPYVLGKQAYHVHRLLGQVDVIITDSPILLCGLIYGSNHHVGALALDIFNSWNTYNVFLTRNRHAHKYNPAGRNQTEQEAVELDERILNMLDFNAICYTKYEMQAGGRTASYIAQDVFKLLEARNQLDPYRKAGPYS